MRSGDNFVFAELHSQSQNFTLLALALLLPLLGAIVNGLFGQRLGKRGVRTMALSVMAGSFACSLLTFATIVTAPAVEGKATRVVWHAWRWFNMRGSAGQNIPIDVKFSADPLSVTMMLIITGVGFLIHLYSTKYMEDDPGFTRFFAYLNLFIFSMLVLVLGDNMVVLFVGWEGVGLCSYLLIGFWYTDEQKAAAGKKAFITNRIGDFGLLLAMAMLLHYAGALDWMGLQARSAGLLTDRVVWPLGNGNLHRQFGTDGIGGFLANALTPNQPFRMFVPTLIGIALFIGCAGKSAQAPLYVWLPDAMAGPTPVSALIHAATMVTAGVYLVARCSFLFVMSPAAMAIVAGTGAFTALLAASIALTQHDLKKVLAYSTVSQLGFMFIGAGSGAFTGGIFHVMTHAFFKGCLFLCAGSVIHAMHARIHSESGSQDMRNMGGLKKYMPYTRATFLISCFAIAGCPPLSGFWSKDLLLFKAFTLRIKAQNTLMWTPPDWFGTAIYAVGALAAVMTAFYMFRAYFLTFEGNFRGWTIVKGWTDNGHDEHHDEHHAEEDEEREGPTPHESPWQMTLPLGILALLALVSGFLFAELLHIEPLAHFLEPVFARASRHVVSIEGAKALEWPLAGAGVAIFAAGAGFAFWTYRVKAGRPAAQIAKALGPVYRGAHNKWYVDEIYEASAIGLVDAMGDSAATMDRWVIDGILARVTSAVVAGAGSLLRLIQTGRVQVYAAAMVVGVAALGWFIATPQAVAEVDKTRLRSQGRVLITAAAGHGYSYRWAIDKGKQPKDFSKRASLPLQLAPCETKVAHLEVRNVFGRTSKKSIEVERACGRGGRGTVPSAKRANAAGQKRQGSSRRAPGLKPGKYDLGDGKLLDKLIKPKRPAAPAKGGAK
jgi:NADH-quinone oxidoreductase subunit L